MTLIQALESRREALTVQEVADLLGVSDKHIYEMIADGRLPAFRVGRSVRIDPQDIADWLRAKRPSAANTGNRKISRVVQGVNQRQGGNGRLKGVLRKKITAMQAAIAIDVSSERHSRSDD
jgi:excisionase family DNA binding protein